MSHPLVAHLRREMSRAADPERAVQQQAYMKSDLPFYGLRLSQVRLITRAGLRAHPISGQQQLKSVVRELWDDVTHREEWYAALGVLMAPAHRTWRSPRLLPLYEHLIATGASWDVVDDIGSHAVREQLLAEPEAVTPRIRRWAGSKDLWCRRAALVCQVGAKDALTPNFLPMSSRRIWRTATSSCAKESDGRCATTPRRTVPGCAASSPHIATH